MKTSIIHIRRLIKSVILHYVMKLRKDSSHTVKSVVAEANEFMAGTGFSPPPQEASDVLDYLLRSQQVLDSSEGLSIGKVFFCDIEKDPVSTSATRAADRILIELRDRGDVEYWSDSTRIKMTNTIAAIIDQEMGDQEMATSPKQE